MQKKKGISLIVLVITIIVMIILAGAIIISLNNNTIIKRSNTAVKINNEQELKQQIEIIKGDVILKQRSGMSKNDALESSLLSIDSEATISISDDWYDVIINSQHFLLNEDLEYVPIVEPKNVSDWKYTEDGVITSYIGSDKNIVIPNYINGIRIKKVKGVGYVAITHVTISEGIEIIGASAFRTKANLTGDLIIPDSVKVIENYAFQWNGNLNGKLRLGKKLETIGEGAFQGCSLTGDLIIPDKVTTIGDGAFGGCKFDGKIQLGKSLQIIGDIAFGGSFKGDLIIPDSVTYIGKKAFYYMRELNGTFKLSKNVETIGDNAFTVCGFLMTTDIVIPESCTYIGARAFDQYSIIPKTITFLNPNTEIGDHPNTAPYSKIIGYAGSTAEAYVNKYGNQYRTFEEISN